MSDKKPISGHHETANISKSPHLSDTAQSGVGELGQGPKPPQKPSKVTLSCLLPYSSSTL